MSSFPLVTMASQAAQGAEFPPSDVSNVSGSARPFHTTRGVTWEIEEFLSLTSHVQ